jgi:hypothetical protein
VLFCEGIIVVLPISVVPEVTPATVVVGAEVILALVPEPVSPDVDCGAVDAFVLVAPSVVTSFVRVVSAEELEAASPVVKSCGVDVDS